MTGARHDLESEFQDFIAGRGVVRCGTCGGDPELRELADAAYKAGHSRAAIADFLTAKGQRVTAGALKNHFERHVS
jgi:hypothetical protein